MAAAAAFSARGRDDAKSIPLVCLLCPKNPTFSDISHLLTHVSSKSHLHNKFNTEFQAKTEPATRERLHSYESWYMNNGIESLLQERLSAKDQKKTGRRGRGALKVRGVSVTVASGTAGAFADRQGALKSNAASVGSQSIKPDPEEGYAGSGMLPSMPLWDPMPNDPSYHVHGARPALYLDDSGLLLPSIKQDPSPYSLHHTPAPTYEDHFHSRQMNFRAQTESTDSAIPSDVTTQVPAEAGEDDAPDANTKLKGTIFPGMDLFDAATPEQKRKRNQRKDSSVLEQMKLTSEAVAALECIWTPEGNFQRSRDIYATPSIDGSPIVTPAPKRKARARRRTPTRDSGAAQTVPPGADDAEKPKRKRTKRVPLVDATNMRQTRSAVKKASAETMSVTDDSTASAVAKLEETDDEVKILTAVREKKGSFDVFRDPPQNVAGEPQLLVPFSDGDRLVPAGQHASPLGDMQSNRWEAFASGPQVTFSPDNTSRFSIGHRSVLQPLNANALVQSSAPQLGHGSQHASPLFGNAMGGHHAPFRSSSSFTAGYMPQHGLAGSSYNPLCAQPSGGLGYHAYHTSLYGETKPPTTSFQPINTRLDFSSFTLASNANHYTNPTHRDTSDFDL